ncbi:MAG: alkaline phosphatase family protein [Candidatus Rokubacteria bacterium]|nr:alkaline phosphatase family protein [Candidatus Rokubacteria bacterium]
MPNAPRRVLILLIDGFDPDYIRSTTLPSLAALVKAGASTLEGRGVLPSLTNVNHISLLTGTYPERHGLCANFYLDQRTGAEVFMDQVAFVREPLLFEQVKTLGWMTVLVTAKEKLTRLLRRGLDLCVDMASAPADLLASVGAAPDIFSMEINLWVLRMAREVAVRYTPGLLYVATTDYPQHKFPPDHREMRRYLQDADGLIGQILETYDLDRDVAVLTADHGMNPKTRSASPVRWLADAGITARGVPLIRDGLYAHHRDLGGALYLYLDDQGQENRAQEILTEAPGIDRVVARHGAPEFHLPRELVGDLICFGQRQWALGVWSEGEAVREEEGLRSHGSLYEQAIPMVMAGAGIRSGSRIERGSIVDLAPTLSRLLGLDSGGFQGRVLEEALA